MTRRDDILLELGIGPIWRKRAAIAPTDDGEGAPSIASDTADPASTRLTHDATRDATARVASARDAAGSPARIASRDDGLSPDGGAGFDPRLGPRSGPRSGPHADADAAAGFDAGFERKVPTEAAAVARGRGAGPDAGGDADRDARIATLDWPALREAVAGCTACGLCRTRTNTVFGVGDTSADIMIVGEAPGAEEDARGEPFVGQAGRLLDSMLAAVDMDRSRGIFIANVLKCRPPGNRNPEPLEVARCSPHLLRQIALVQPKLIVAMGRFAAQTLLASDASIASMRGRLFRYGGVPLVVTYHPAYLLRNLPDKSKAWEDLLFMRRTLAAAAASAESNGTQA